MNLSPEIIKMREALLERIGDKPLKEVAHIVNEILLNETNTVNRLAALAARVKVLRNYINKNYEVKNKPKRSELNTKKENIQPTEVKSNDIIKNSDESWVRVEMLKSGVVNGVRFPEGVVIDVSKNDADNLIVNKLAKIVDTKLEDKVETKLEDKVEDKVETKLEDKLEDKVETKLEDKVEDKVETKLEDKLEDKVETKLEDKLEDKVETKLEDKVETKLEDKVEIKLEDKVEEESKIDKITKDSEVKTESDKKIIKTKSTKITEETIELTDPKAVAEALGLNDKKKKEQEPKEIEEEIDIEAIETGKKK